MLADPHFLRAIRAAIVAGFVACLSYALIATAHIGHIPLRAVAVLFVLFGPAYGIASFGIRGLLDLDRPRASASLGLLLNVVGGAIFTTMGLLQLAFGAMQPGGPVPVETRALWLGVDVAWDAFLCCGTACLALAMLRHPRFGRIFSFTGLAIATGLIALHLVTFPYPPQNAGFFDLGPAIGIWYLTVTIQMVRSLHWAADRDPGQLR